MNDEKLLVHGVAMILDIYVWKQTYYINYRNACPKYTECSLTVRSTGTMCSSSTKKLSLKDFTAIASGAADTQLLESHA